MLTENCILKIWTATLVSVIVLAVLLTDWEKVSGYKDGKNCRSVLLNSCPTF